MAVLLALVACPALASVITLQGTFVDGPSNCIPFGGHSSNFMGFVYKNVPAFTLGAGDTIAFDLGAANDQPIVMDIALANAVSNGSMQEDGGGFTTVVTAGTAADPDGNAVATDYELVFTAQAPFSFAGGGLIVRFKPVGSFATDTNCTQVLEHSDANDPSGFFVGRFYQDPDGAFPWSGQDNIHIGIVRFNVGVCGNSLVESGEQCDDGNTTNGDCCSSTCQFEPPSTVCRPSAGICDSPENCTGTSATCPPDGKSTTVCRSAAGICDVAESCDGVSNDCPADSVAGAFVVCRSSVGSCDLAEHCTGSGVNCPADVKSTAVCRSAAGVCDLAEICDGLSNNCPADSVAGAFVVCRPSAGSCDLAEHCGGSGVDCPADAKSTAVCRSATGICDVAESCDGVNNTCPGDGFAPTSTTCRSAAGACDVAEHCTGASAACPANGFAPDGTSCNDGNPATFNDQCTAGVCQGASAECGNGVIESPEQCDDGVANGTAGSCCTATCTARAAGADCDDDGNLCTNDECDGAGGCSHTVAPAPSCAEPTVAKGAALKIVSKTAPATDQVKFKWGKGPIVPNADFGAPGTTTTYQVCIYQSDDTLVYQGQPAGGVCGVAPCWKALATGWKFTSKTGAPDGVTGVKLKEGLTPLKAKIQVKAKGNLTLATMPVTAPVVAQLRTSDGQCWGASFATPVKNDGLQFSAKSSETTTTTSSTTTTTLASGCFTDTGDGTIHDTCTGLQWEKKTTAPGSGLNPADLNDGDNLYTWSGCCDGDCSTVANFCQPNAAASAACLAHADGGTAGCNTCTAGTCNTDPHGQGAITTMWDWVGQLNAANFAGHNDWRLPSEGGRNTPPTGTNELETILGVSAAGCGSGTPCIDPIFGPTPFYAYYRSATTTNPGKASDVRFIYFGDGGIYYGAKDYFGWVRAVRP